MAEEKINISCPSGFIEFLPGEKRLEQKVLNVISGVFEKYGFTLIETPAIERLEVFQAKGNQGDNIIYGISPLLPPNRLLEKELSRNDNDSEKRALKFDQTVPLAAYIGRHLNDLTFPFARYQMDMVWRGERAKEGRFRQFRQCDIDVVARGELSLMYDAQMPSIIAEIFNALNIGKFLIRINNRKVLTGFFSSIGIKETDVKKCISTIDKLEHIGKEKVKKELASMDISEEKIEKVFNFTNISGSTDEILTQLKEIEGSEVFKQGVDELEQVISGVRALGVAEDSFCIDLSIARGLNYYTGTVYETTLLGYESFGSICSGGRYEELMGMFVDEKMPGVGISIGLTRLLMCLLKAGILKPLEPTPTQIVVLNLDNTLMSEYLKIAQRLRKVGINTETVFTSQKLGKQIKTVDKKGISFCLILGSEELAQEKCVVKNLKNGEQIEIPLVDLESRVKTLVDKILS